MAAGLERDEQRRRGQVDAEVVGGGDRVHLGVGCSRSSVVTGDDLPIRGQDCRSYQRVRSARTFAGSAQGGGHRRGFEFGELRCVAKLHAHEKTSRALAGREDIAGATIRASQTHATVRSNAPDTAAEATMLLPSRL